MRGEWKCVLVESGGQCVMICGVKLMHELFANSLDMPQVALVQVYYLLMEICEKYIPLFIRVGLIHTAYGSAQFGEGTGDIVMDDVACGGSELWLYDCPHTSQHNCRHREDASVLCSG